MQEELNGQTQLQQLSEALGLKNPDTKLQSHGITVGQMKEHHQAQISGDVEMMDANNSKGYKIKVAEKHLVHISKDAMRFDENDGHKISKPILGKYYVDDFEKMSETIPRKKPDGSKTVPENAFKGFKVTILHDPRKGTDKEVKPSPVNKKTKAIEDLDEMSDEQLRAKYLEVFGNEADESDSPQMIRALIKDDIASKK